MLQASMRILRDPEGGLDDLPRISLLALRQQVLLIGAVLDEEANPANSNDKRDIF